VEPKQAKMKELIVEYFQQREDTEIDQNIGGIYRVKLKSEAARVAFGDRKHNDQISLIFDPDRAYLNPGCELISVGHSLLEVIHNDLERDALYEPRLSEAHLLPQLIDPMGQLSLPHVVFSSRNQSLRYHLSYHPTLILTYSIIYEDDERSENVVRLCYDGITSTLRPDVSGQLQQVYPVDGPPKEGHLLIDNLDVTPFLAAGKREIEESVTADSKIKAREIATKFEEEKKRLNNHYETEIANIPARDHVTRKQLQETLEKNIADAERKFNCQVNIRLLSILRLWWPVVDYTAAFTAHRNVFEIGDIRYDMMKGYTSLFRCEACGNRTHFDVCAIGQHATCGGQCSTGLPECSVCHDPFCRSHGSSCNGCSAPVCQYDRQQCSYGKHSQDEYYCPKCLVQSFDGRPLCTDCQELCDICHRAFPHELISRCRIGNERVCTGHTLSPDAYKCQDCGQVTCKAHGLRTSDGNWACTDHALKTSCCGEIHLKSRLRSCCVDPREILCPKHSVICLGCKKPVCSDHRNPLTKHTGHFTCDMCQNACVLCGSEQHYLANDLASCNTCGKSLCEDHRTVCKVGGEIVCRDDLRISVDQEALCPLHAANCVQCGTGPAHPVYRTDSLRKCSICQNNVCQKHSSVCSICGATHVCNVHLKTQPTCENCGRSSCGSSSCKPDSHTCRSCEMKYCHHCVNTSTGYCITCEGLKETLLSDNWFKMLRKIQANTINKGAAEALASMLKSPNQLSFNAASNQTYGVFVLRYTARWYQLWKKSVQVRIVMTKTGKLIKVKIEKIR
jgi:hypothetical protein